MRGGCWRNERSTSAAMQPAVVGSVNKRGVYGRRPEIRHPKTGRLRPIDGRASAARTRQPSPTVGWPGRSINICWLTVMILYRRCRTFLVIIRLYGWRGCVCQLNRNLLNPTHAAAAACGRATETDDQNDTVYSAYRVGKRNIGFFPDIVGPMNFS